MATHPRILAWKMPWTGEPGGLQSVGSQMNQMQLSLCTHARMHAHLSALWVPLPEVSCSL